MTMLRLNIYSVVILIVVLLFTCLPQVHAKGIRRILKHSAVGIVGNYIADHLINTTHAMTKTANISCHLPKLNQLKYYNKLYRLRGKAAKSFNGNIVYYALKAAKTPLFKFAAADIPIIANITDHTRFTPAGMDTANKIVCAKILQEMDSEASLFSNTALCAWDYICDYKAGRFPNYLFKARCKTLKCNGNCSRVNHNHNMCQSHGIHVTVLQMRGNCGEWVWGQELLPIACTCTSDIMMKVESMPG